jgi:tagaturonate reductase
MIKKLNKTTTEKIDRPVQVLQFGEGNFLRAFVDWLIDIANEKGVMNTGVAICKPRNSSEKKSLTTIDLLNAQDNMYHVYLEGIENKEPRKDIRLVKSVMDAFNPYDDYAKYETYILSPELKMVISNTTEAGIRYEEGDDLSACPPKSYPAAEKHRILASRFDYPWCPFYLGPNRRRTAWHKSLFGIRLWMFSPVRPDTETLHPG